MVKLVQCRKDKFIERVNKRNVICFGAGNFLDKYADEFFFVCPKLIIDNYQTGTRCLAGIQVPIISPNDILKEHLENSVILIVTSQYSDAIEQLDRLIQFDSVECFIPYPFFSSGDVTHIHRYALDESGSGDGKHYQIRERHPEAYHAGSKAPEDIYSILSRSGYDSLEVHICDDSLPDDHWSKKRALDEWESIERKISENAILVLQHPSWGGFQKKYQILKSLKAKGVRIAVFVHDYERLRNELYSGYMIREEEFIFELADVLVVHNDKMKSVFLKDGFSSSKLITIKLFDYLCKEKEPLVRSFSTDIVIAGNLNIEKNPHIGMLKELNSIQFHLYGPNYLSAEIVDNINYYGTEIPERLPNILPNGFGLVWGGDSLSTCSGYAGDYLRYNNPHKLSLYLASGLPVIVWDESATADYVIENNIGLTVHSLYDLSSILDSITPEEYDNYAVSVRRIGSKLRKGEYTKEAIKQIDVMMEDI